MPEPKHLQGVPRHDLVEQIERLEADNAALRWSLARTQELLDGANRQCERIRGWYFDQKRAAEKIIELLGRKDG